MTKQQQRELGSVPYDILHAHVQQKDLIITQECKCLGACFSDAAGWTLSLLAREAEHQNRRN